MPLITIKHIRKYETDTTKPFFVANIPQVFSNVVHTFGPEIQIPTYDIKEYLFNHPKETEIELKSSKQDTKLFIQQDDWSLIIEKTHNHFHSRAIKKQFITKENIFNTVKKALQTMLPDINDTQIQNLLNKSQELKIATRKGIQHISVQKFLSKDINIFIYISNNNDNIPEDNLQKGITFESYKINIALSNPLDTI